MDPVIVDIERQLAALKADVTILENTVNSLKEVDISISRKVDASENSLVEIKMGLTSDFSKVNTDIHKVRQELIGLTKEVSVITTHVESMEEKVSSISHNSLLEFTSEMDFKKILTIIVVIISIVTSPSVVGSFLEPGDKTSSERLDKLIELLEDAN